MAHIGVREKSRIHQTPYQKILQSGGSMWLFRTKTAAIGNYPGDGYMLWDDLTQVSATHLVFSHATADNLDLDVILPTLASGDTLYVQDSANADNYQQWTVSGPAVNSTIGGSYWMVPVTFVSSGGTGTTNFPNNVQLSVFVKSSSGGGGGTVTSIDITSTAGTITPTGGPVTTAGNINVEITGLPVADATDSLGASSRRWVQFVTELGGDIAFDNGFGSQNQIAWTDGTGPTFADRVSGKRLIFNIQALSADRTATWQNSSGTVAWLTDIPSSLPPSGAAGGDLAGTYPNPTVFQAHLTDQAVPSPPASGTLTLASYNQQGFSVAHVYDTQGNAIELTRDDLFIVRNTSGGTITKGQAVYLTGTTGTVGTVALAKADSASTMPCAAVAYETAVNNAYFRVMKLGHIESINLSAYSNADTLYVSATTAGALVSAAPTTFPQSVGLVINNGVGNGVLSVILEPAPYVNWNYTGYTAKTTPVAADLLLLADSAASNQLKKITYANLTAGVTYTADNSTLQLIGNQFSEKDGGTTNAKLANMAAHTMKVNITGSAAAPTDSTPAAWAAAEIGALVSGRVVSNNGSILVWADGVDDSSLVSVASDDFLVGLGNLAGNATTKIGTFSTAISSGANAATAHPVTSSAVDGMIGVVSLATGTTSGGFAQVQGISDLSAANDGPSWVYGSAQIEATFWFKTDASLSSGSERYSVFCGMVDGQSNTIGGSQNGINVNYRDDLGSTFSIFVRVAGVGQTRVFGTTTVAVNTKYVVKLVLNVARTQVDLYVRTYGSAFPSSPEASYTGSLPAANSPLGPQMAILKSIGTTQRLIYADRWQVVTRLAR